MALSTDAFGCIDFRGTRTNKAQYLRLSYDTKPDRVLNLLLRQALFLCNICVVF